MAPLKTPDPVASTHQQAPATGSLTGRVITGKVLAALPGVAIAIGISNDGSNRMVTDHVIRPATSGLTPQARLASHVIVLGICRATGAASAPRHPPGPRGCRARGPFRAPRLVTSRSRRRTASTSAAATHAVNRRCGRLGRRLGSGDTPTARSVACA